MKEKIQIYGVKEFVCLSVVNFDRNYKMMKWVYLDSVFRLKSNLRKNNCPDLHHLQRGMKFATKISPLLYLYFLLQFKTGSRNHYPSTY